jgi:hypothetical protein
MGGLLAEAGTVQVELVLLFEEGFSRYDSDKCAQALNKFWAVRFKLRKMKRAKTNVRAISKALKCVE